MRQAISYGINRQQLSTQGESGYEPPATSSGGLLLPIDNTFLDPALANDLPPTGDPAKVASILTGDGYTKVGGKWTKNGKTISFSITDPIPYSDYYTDAQLIAKPAQQARLQRHGRRHRQPDRLAGRLQQRHLRRRDPLEQPGPEPVLLSTSNWMRQHLSAPVGKPAAADIGRFNDPAAQAALAQFAGTKSPAAQKAAITRLENIMSTQVPVAPLLYGAAWGEYSTRDYTGWPSASNPYMNPSRTRPYLE